jgi:hypothetical protein
LTVLLSAAQSLLQTDLGRSATLVQMTADAEIGRSALPNVFARFDY